MGFIGSGVSENVMQYAIHFAKVLGSSIDSLYVVRTTLSKTNKFRRIV